MIEFWTVLGLLSFLWIVKIAESEEKFARIFLLTILWVITHYAILFILRSVEDIGCFRWIKNIQKDTKGTKDVKLTNLARLIRSQLYCIFSTVAGLYIIGDFSDWPNDLLHLWKPHYEIIFEISASQWIWSLAEDMLCREQVVAHMIIPPGQEKNLYESFSQGLFYHHLFTIFAFSWSLCTHKLSGLCAFGLLFEAPVLLMNLRDIFATFHLELQGFPYNSIWCRCFGGMGFQLYAFAVGVIFVFVRGGACSLWPISLVVWRSQLSILPIGSQVVYHTLGIAFCYVNSVVFFTYVIRYLMEDLVRMKALPLQSFYKTIGWVETQETNATVNPTDIEAAAAPESAIAADTTTGTSIAAVKFTIAGQIYDVTSFLDSHPGGRDVLLMASNSGNRHPGESTSIADATEAFNEVGHSQHARNMMKRFLISETAVVDHSLATAVPAIAPTIRPEDPDEDNENSPEIFKHPYRIGLDYSSVPSTQALFVVTLVVFAIFFLAAGFRKHTSIGYSHLRSLSDYSEHVLQSLPYTVFPLILPFLSFAFAPSCEHLMHWQTHVAALLWSTSMVLDFSLLRLEDQQSSGLRLLRVSVLLTFAVETISRRISPFTRSSAYMMVSNWRSLSFRGCFYEFTKRVFFSFTDAITFVILLVSVSEIFTVHTVYQVSSRDGDGTYVPHMLSILVLLSAIARVLAFRSINFPTALDDSKEGSDNAVYNPLEVLGPGICTLFLSFIYTLAALVITWWFQTRSTSQASPSLVTMDLSVISSALHSIMDRGQVFRAVFLLAYMVLSFVNLMLPSLVTWSGPHFMSQYLSLSTVLALWPVAGPLAHSRWFSFGLLSIALHLIGKESIAVLREPRKAADNSGLQRPPYHLYAIKQLEEVFRSFFGYFIVHWIVVPVLWIVNLVIVPDGLLYYMYPSILANMGPRCDYGVALQINGSPQGAPKVFQLNVGQLDAEDLVRTTTSTREMMQEILEDPEAGDKGFVTDIVALFPLRGQSGKRGAGKQYAFREVNLSAWTSERAAHDWYVQSPAHRKVVRNYKGKKNFSSFSAMFASLSAAPDRPLRWEVRCRGCKTMCRTLTNDAAMSCPTCGKTVDPMPYM